MKDESRYAAPIVITNAEYRFIVGEQAEELGIKLAGVLLEPVARNTTAAIVAAAVFAEKQSGAQSVIHVLPSDHSVDTDDNYWASVDTAARRPPPAGWSPSASRRPGPETGYGYIEAGKARGDGTWEVARFVEKPDLAKAEAMLKQGGFTWNSGMFMLGVATFLGECRALSPESFEAASAAVDKAKTDLDFIRLDLEELRQGAEHLGRLRHLRKDQADQPRAGHLFLVRPRQLGCGMEGLATRTLADNAVLGDATLSNTTQFVRPDARRPMSPSKGSTMSR